MCVREREGLKRFRDEIQKKKICGEGKQEKIQKKTNFVLFSYC